MDPFTQMMHNIIDAQQKTFSLIYENSKTPIDYGKDYLLILENNIKFHKAAVAYNASIVEMLEAFRDNSKVFGFMVKPNQQK
jgi:hypothetical protein